MKQFAKLGIDCCEAFLAIGRDDIASQKIGNVELVEGDVQTYPFDGSYDFCFSRFGTQFFENPVAALRAELKKYETSDGIVMQSSSWKVLARNPG